MNTGEGETNFILSPSPHFMLILGASYGLVYIATKSSLRAKRSNLLRLPRRPAKAGVLAMTTWVFRNKQFHALGNT
jgi:hypothetical protein